MMIGIRSVKTGQFLSLTGSLCWGRTNRRYLASVQGTSAHLTGPFETEVKIRFPFHILVSGIVRESIRLNHAHLIYHLNSLLILLLSSFI